MDYKQFEQQWLGKVVDTDNYPKDAIYQCVDLIKRYMRDVHGVPFGTYGNAIDYWHRTHSAIVQKFARTSGSEAKAGDIVVLNGVNGNVFGHIGIATGWIDATHVEILEQNGSTGNGQGQGNDRIRKRRVPRSRVAGLLRPRSAATRPPETPEGYTVHRDIPAYYTSLDAKNRRNARGTVRARTYAVFNRANGMVNVTTEQGTPGAWINPADNAAPAPKPPAETYHLNQDVPGYRSSADAIARRNSNSTVRRGIYKLTNRVKGADHLVRPDGTGGWWIKV